MKTIEWSEEREVCLGGVSCVSVWLGRGERYDPVREKKRDMTTGRNNEKGSVNNRIKKEAILTEE